MSDMHSLSVKDYISLQPLWKIHRSHEYLLQTSSGQTVAQVFSFSTDEDNLPCIPGIGMAALVLSTNPERPQVFLCGPLSERRSIPLSGINQGVYCRFLPGQVGSLFHISCKELSNLETPLEDIMSIGSFASQFAEGPTEDHRSLLLQLLNCFSLSRRGGDSPLSVSTIDTGDLV